MRHGALTGAEAGRVLARMGADPFVCGVVNHVLDAGGWATAGPFSALCTEHIEAHAWLVSLVLARRVSDCWLDALPVSLSCVHRSLASVA